MSPPFGGLIQLYSASVNLSDQWDAGNPDDTEIDIVRCLLLW